MEWYKVGKKLPKIGEEVLIRIPVSDLFNIESGTYLGDGVFAGAWGRYTGDCCDYTVSEWTHRSNLFEDEI